MLITVYKKERETDTGFGVGFKVSLHQGKKRRETDKIRVRDCLFYYSPPYLVYV